MIDRDIYYGTDYFGDRTSNFDFDTADDVKKWLDEKFAEQCEFDGIKNAEIRTDTATIYGVDENLVTVSEDEYEMRYEGYHGDRREHGTYWGPP